MNLNPDKLKPTEKKEIFEDIVFQEKKKKDGTVIGYQNSAPGRKAIVLSPDSDAPILGRPYKVEFVEDTKPDNPDSGMIIGKLIVSDEEKISDEQWKEIETRTEDAEKFRRKSSNASREIYKITGISLSERKGSADTILKEHEDDKKIRLLRKSIEQEISYNELAESILGKENSLERSLVGLEKKNLANALSKDKEIGKKRKDLFAEETGVMKLIESEPSGAQIEVLEEIRKELQDLEKQKENTINSNPEAFYGLHLKELKKYKRSLAQGEIAETDYVQEKAEDISVHLKANKPVLIYGHLGSGKTELAMHVARNYLSKEALVISGSKNMSLAEFYGHQILAIDKINKGELDNFVNEVENKFKEWVKKNPDVTEEEKNRSHDRLLQTYLTQFKGGTISDYFLGPIYRAMEEGRPIIIDEVNAIPHEILISLNNILTKKVGDTVNVQQDSGRMINIGEGYGVIMTGNLNQGEEKYIDRQDMDPAFLSRLYKLEYDYLPQKTAGPLEEAGKEDELFHLLIAMVMDKNGNAEMPEDTFKKMWNLSKAARVFQNVFAGKEIDSAYYFQQEGGARSVKYILKEAVLSLRAIDNIVSQWQKEGYKNELDYYIWKEFVSQSTVASDKAYIYQVLKDSFNFFQSQDWEKNPNYGTSGIINSFNIDLPKNKPEKRKFFGPREIVKTAYGKAPERAKWPDTNNNSSE
jgi:MoxR-like ATPase